MSEEILEKDNAFFCDSCNKRASQAVKTSSILSLSSSIILTANRFYYDVGLKRRIKKMNPIKFCYSLIVPEKTLEDKSKYDPSFYEYELYAIIIHSVPCFSAQINRDSPLRLGIITP